MQKAPPGGRTSKVQGETSLSPEGEKEKGDVFEPDQKSEGELIKEGKSTTKARPGGVSHRWELKAFKGKGDDSRGTKEVDLIRKYSPSPIPQGNRRPGGKRLGGTIMRKGGLGNDLGR